MELINFLSLKKGGGEGSLLKREGLVEDLRYYHNTNANRR